MSRRRTPKGEWHARTVVLHALRSWWKSTTPYAEQLLLPGMEPPPVGTRTAGPTKSFILALLAEARPDGTVVFSRDYAEQVYSIGRQQYQREARWYKRRGVLVVTRRPAPGHPAVYSLRVPEWLAHFIPEEATGVLERPASPNTTGVPERPPFTATGVLERPNGGASTAPTKRSKKHAAPRESAGAALHAAGGPADDDAAAAGGAASPPAGGSNGSRPKTKTNDTPTPMPPPVAEVLGDPREPYRPGGPDAPRRVVRSKVRPPGFDRAVREADEAERQRQQAALAALATGTPDTPDTDTEEDEW